MAKGIPNFYRGDTFKVAMTFAPEDDASSVVDITGWIITTTLKSDVSLADDAAAWHVSITAPANASSQAGQMILVVPSTTTAAVTPGRYFLDIERRIPGTGGEPDDVLTVLFQEIECLPDVSRGVQ